MQIEFSQDQTQFREVVSRFFQAHSTTADVRRLMDSDTGFDPTVWQQMSQQLGLLGTHLPEAYGGFGFGPVELGIAAEEMGRQLYCGPFFSSVVMAAGALMECGSEQAKHRLLPMIATGESIATLVLDSLSLPADLGQDLRTTSDGLSGTARMVTDAHIADRLIVIATTDSGLGLFEVDSTASGVHIDQLESLDPTRKLSRVSFTAASALQIGVVTPVQLERLWNYLCTALAHEMMGGAQQLFDSTVAYTKVRVQFGRPIGSFQALKHRCADLLLELELAKAATHHAAFCLAAGSASGSAASMAKAMASDVYMEAARTAIQLRGGIGFTWEDDTHLWYKRAKASEVFLGGPHLHRERLLSLLEAA